MERSVWANYNSLEVVISEVVSSDEKLDAKYAKNYSERFKFLN